MKKSIVTIPLLALACVLVILFGTRYAASQRDEMHEDQLDSDTHELNELEEEDDQASQSGTDVLSAYESRLDTLSLYERIDYQSLLEEETKIAFYADIDMEADWTQLVLEQLQAQATAELAVTDFTYPDLDSYELYIQQTVQSVVTEEPAFVFYGMPALPDQIRDIGLSETEEYMTFILNRLGEIENTQVVLIEPYPMIDQIGQMNSRSLDYQSYLNRMRQLAENRQLTVIPVHSVFMEQAEAEGTGTYFDGESLTLNAQGHQLVSEIIDSSLSATLQQ
ncbi:hypothetical protein ADIAL_2211 [Alkalibacterium sp. AK22]|uniref:hypothetical protein n=1 Tax=Alkalibacterium sp. AK22 TaxID=1229520 RepID=UPI0004485578|nr:hypothetical protein [Alkalibacterium sp. AK22]EXJ22625.1 hypothetical protein ADIAL_2211 [Alkalibacterium sp. AK22]